MNITRTVARIINAIETDLNGRCGLELDTLDDGTRDEIVVTWAEKILHILREEIAGS